MSDRASRIGIAVVLAVLAAAALSCAHSRIDTPQFRVCRAVCAADGLPLAGVYEDDEIISCECRKPPAPAGSPT